MFQVLHARKIPTQVGLINVLSHNSREKIKEKAEEEFLDPDWKPDGLHQNGIPYAQALALRTAQLQDLKRKPQKNASKAIEFNISAGEGFENWRDFFQEASQFLKEKFGKENCISSSIHTDETTPHMHMVFVPIIKNAKGERRYSSSNFLGGRNGLAQLHTEFYEQVGNKFGLERGIEGSRAKHSDVQDFKKKVKAVEQREKRLSDADRSLSEREKQLESDLSSLNEKRAIINESVQFCKENSMGVFKEIEQNEKDAFFFPHNPREFLGRIKKALTGAWELVRNLSNKNQKLEQENAELKRQNQIWQEETTPEQFREIADTLEKNHCSSWKQYKDRQKRIGRNQESGIGY